MATTGRVLPVVRVPGTPGPVRHPIEEVIRVAISLSVVLLLAIVLIVMVRGGSLKVGPMIVAILFGFFLASTGMAPAIQRFLDSLADTINAISI